MSQTREQAERITRYLLGDLPEPEQTALEQAYFSDPEKFEAVWAAENDLIDRYVRGRLAGGERELFERRYLQAPGRRDRVAFAQSLLRAADRPGQSSPVPSGGAPTSPWWRRFRETLKGPRLLRAGLATAALLLLAAGFTWLALERGRLKQELGTAAAQLAEQRRREQETADQLAAEREQSGKLRTELERVQAAAAQGPSQPPTGPSVLSFFLSPVLVRGAGEPRQITISRETRSVRLQMAVEQTASLRFQALVRTVEGEQLWSQRSIRPGAGKVSVSIPTNRLPDGEYILTLSATTPGGATEEVNRYYFRVIRQ